MYNFEPYECAIAIQYGAFEDPPFVVLNLPCYPEEVAADVSSSWSEQTIIGRTGTLAAYTGTSNVKSSFSFDLHRDMMVPNASNGSAPFGEDIDEIISKIKSGCYPQYGNNVLQPPRVTWKFGDMYISGRLDSVHEIWKTPIIKGAYAICSLSIQMTSATKKIVDRSHIARTAASGSARNARSHVFGDEYTFGR